MFFIMLIDSILGANKLSEIAGRCGEVSTNLSRLLAKLKCFSHRKNINRPYCGILRQKISARW